ncbi:sensor domain-containing phosphodiesterase [uncultured Pluralibacter sp.]|uniref:sensor domain-containing phosphodiesterase n=1 Tax=uncultured Pluralibacter sp. TaxID=1490864 RepID=UPI002620962F|nr:sensor domain-containing phosphodiesterase [uncultured Pluralibacter sp.]
MRVSRSLTIKQMAAVAGVTAVFVFVFCSILLFHFVKQHRYLVATQLETVARSVREPLSSAILKGDIPEAEAILARIKPAGIASRADVVLPNQFQALRMRFVQERPVPVTMTRLFELPVQISLPIYSLQRPANPQPLAYLVLQSDSYRTYKFVMSALSTLVTTYFLLVLILTVAITWCISRLIVRPLRAIAREINDVSPEARVGHQLALPRLHHDDELGMLVRSYNRNQLILQEALTNPERRHAISALPDEAFLLLRLAQTVREQKTTALLLVSCETLLETAGALSDSQHATLLLTLTGKIASALSPRMLLCQTGLGEFAILADGVKEPGHAMALSQQVLTLINECRLPGELQLRPAASIGIAMFHGGLSAGQLYHRACSAAHAARGRGKNHIAFFDDELAHNARQRLAEESDILAALEDRRFALWLQPQMSAETGRLAGAEALLRVRQPDGSWTLPADLIERIEVSGLMVPVGHWVLEEACRLLAGWQSRGIMLPLSVNLSALQLMHYDMLSATLELLNRYRIAPGTLTLEVTESRRLDDREAMMVTLRPLRKAGVKIALDDFGMGYAGLSQLQQIKSLPVDVLKIDKLFVDALPEDSTVIAAIVSLARAIGLNIVAEGVETQEQHDWLRDAGIDVLQGFFYGRALPPALFEQDYFPVYENSENR